MHFRKAELVMLSDCKEKISIVVPAYNIAKYIPRCLESILSQTYTNLEIIVVNDGSEDETESVIKEFCEKDNRVKLISKVNEGVAKARRDGIKSATGQWIGFVDGDDFIEPDMYEALLSNAKRYNADISHCGYQMVFPSRVDYYYNTSRLVQQDTTTGLKDLLSGSFIEPGLWNKLFHKTLFQSLLQDDALDLSIKINEDLLMNYYLFKASRKSVYEDKCFYHYILRKGSAATSSVNKNKLEDPLKVLKTIKKDCEFNRDLLEIVNARISSALIGLATMNCKVNRELIKPYRKQARKELSELLPEMLKGNHTFKRKFLCLWVAIWPWSYRFIHNCYAKVTDVDKKYEVK